MGQVNYMGGRLNAVKTRNRDQTLQIRKRHFGKQRLKTLSDYLQAVNNPIPRVIPDPVREISLAHAHTRCEPNSDTSIFGNVLGRSRHNRRYHSYIPAPSVISSEFSDSLAETRTLDAKLTASRILHELARVEPAALDYQRKRLLETPDLTGLIARRQRMEAAQTTTALQVATAYSDDGFGDEPMLDYHNPTFENSSPSLVCNLSEVYDDPMSFCNERATRNDEFSPVSFSSICSFPQSRACGAIATSPVISERRCPDVNQVSPSISDARFKSRYNYYDEAEDYCDTNLAEIYTSDSVIVRSKERRLERASFAPTTRCDTFYDIVMSDEWLAFSKMLDANAPPRLFESPSSKTKSSQIPSVVDIFTLGFEQHKHGEVLCSSDLLLGLDFYVFPRLLSERLSQKKESNVELSALTQFSPLNLNQGRRSPTEASISKYKSTNEVATVESEDQVIFSGSDSNASSLVATIATSSQLERRYPNTIPLDSVSVSSEKEKSSKLRNSDADLDAFASSDIPSILLNGCVSPSNSQSESCANVSDFIHHSTATNEEADQYKYDSRSQWDELMEELLEPVYKPLLSRGFLDAQIFDSKSEHPSEESLKSSSMAVHLSSETFASEMKNSQPPQVLKIGSSFSHNSYGSLPLKQGVGAVTETVRTRPIADLNMPKNMNKVGREDSKLERSATSEVIKGPLLFAFTFTSDREDEESQGSGSIIS